MVALALSNLSVRDGNDWGGCLLCCLLLPPLPFSLLYCINFIRPLVVVISLSSGFDFNSIRIIIQTSGN